MESTDNKTTLTISTVISSVILLAIVIVIMTILSRRRKSKYPSNELQHIKMILLYSNPTHQQHSVPWVIFIPKDAQYTMSFVIFGYHGFYNLLERNKGRKVRGQKISKLSQIQLLFAKLFKFRFIKYHQDRPICGLLP